MMGYSRMQLYEIRLKFQFVTQAWLFRGTIASFSTSPVPSQTSDF